MAVCPYCEQEMTDPNTKSCVSSPVKIGGEDLDPVPFDSGGYRCGDCKIADGGIHHPGCDMERCPACGGQLISCGCLSEDDQDETSEAEV